MSEGGILRRTTNPQRAASPSHFAVIQTRPRRPLLSTKSQNPLDRDVGTLPLSIDGKKRGRSNNQVAEALEGGGLACSASSFRAAQEMHQPKTTHFQASFHCLCESADINKASVK